MAEDEHPEQLAWGTEPLPGAPDTRAFPEVPPGAPVPAVPEAPVPEAPTTPDTVAPEPVAAPPVGSEEAATPPAEPAAAPPEPATAPEQASPPAEPAPPKPPREPRTTAPLWVYPAIVVGLAYPATASSARLDVEMIERLPEPHGKRFEALSRLPNFWTWIVVGVAIILAVVFGFFRLGISDVWTESFLFMVLALGLGMFSPAAALLMVIVFIPLDFWVSWQSGTLEPFLQATAGRAISWWLLWLLAVALPLMARALPGATIATGQPREPMIRKILGYGAGALAAGFLIAAWVGAGPFLIRPVFTWSDWYRYPTTPAIAPMQDSGTQLIIAAVLFVLAVTLLRDALNVLDEEAMDLNAPQELGVEEEPLVSDAVQFIIRIITDLFAVIALGGIITGAVEVAVLFGTLIIAKPVADLLLKRVPVVVQAVSLIPWVIRFLVGFALTYVVGIVVSNALAGTDINTNTFAAIVISVAVGLFVLQILLEVDLLADEIAEERVEGQKAPPAAPPPPPPAPEPSGGTIAASLAAGAILAGMLLIAFPAGTRADNCSGPGGDCPSTAEAQAGAAAGAAGVVAVTAIVAAARVSDRRGKRQKVKRRKPGKDEEAEATDETQATADGTADAGTGAVPGAAAPPPGAPSLAQSAQQRAMKNYWRK